MRKIYLLAVLLFPLLAVPAPGPQLIKATPPLSLSNGRMSLPASSGSQNGYLSSTDWTAFNSKLSGTILTTKGDLLGFSSVVGRLPVGTNTQVLTADSTSTFGWKWADAGSGSGTVSSVGLTLPNIFSVAGSPVTTTGTLAGTLVTQTANTVLSGPTTGSAATPAFRLLVAADVPNLPASIITSGQIGIGNGGTGAATKSAAFDALSPLSALGDTLYGGASGTGTRLAGNTSATKKFLSQTGDSVNSAPPAWGQVAFTDVTGSVAAAQLPNPTSSSLGGVQSAAPVSNQWINSISTSGVPALSQPAFTNISGSVAASQLPNPSSTTLGGIQSYAAVSNQWINTISTLGVPSSSQPAFSNISGSVAASQLPNPSSTTLGGIQSYAAVSNQWINTISTSGVPSSTQPAFSNLSGSVASTQMPALTGDVTTSAGAVATTVAKIQSTTVSGTTGTGNVVFSASPTLTGTAVLASATVSGTLKSGNYHLEPSENDAGNSSTAQTIDWSTGSAQKSTLTGSVTYTFTNPQTGGAYVLRIATGAGSFTATWPVTVKWSGGTAPTITATASKIDLINFYYDGTNYYGSYTQNY